MTADRRSNGSSARRRVPSRVLLRAFPRAFRTRFGSDLVEAFADRLAQARRRGPARYALAIAQLTIDAVRHGWAERALEHGQATGGRPMLQALNQDLRFGWRTLRQRPGVTLAAVATLAIGIGASTAVFSVADALLLRALPYPAPDRLVALEDRSVTRGNSYNVALQNFDDWRASVEAIDAAAAWQQADVNLVGASGADRLTGAVVAGDFFEIVGGRPIAGRLLAADEPTATVVVLSESAWRRVFGGAREAVGATATLDGTAYQVIGVVPNVPALREVDVWRPVNRSAPPPPRTNHAWRAVARLRPGVTLDAARAELDAVAARLEAAYPATNTNWRVSVTPLLEFMAEDLGSSIRLVAIIAGLLLLVACTNVAGLLVARASDRARELAVRVALGAGRVRLVRQLMTESVLVSIAGAIAGLVLAQWCAALIVGVLPEDVVPWQDPTLSASVAAFAVAVALVAGVATGFAPAFAVIRPHAPDMLRTGTATASLAARRTRGALVFVQVAVATVLLMGTGLLTVSLWTAARVDPGIDPESVLTFRATPPRQTHADAAAVRAYHDALLARLRSLPQIEIAGATSGLPAAGNETISTLRRPDEPQPARGDERFALHQIATPGYLRASGTRLVAGRDFTDADTAGADPVVIVNASLASELWPGQSPIGREVILEPETRYTVVGLVADVRHFGLDQTLYRQYFIPFAQSPTRALSFALRLRAPFAEDDARRVAAAVDATVPIFDVRPFSAIVSGSLSSRRHLTAAAAVCGLSAAALALVGLAGVIATAVRDRRREIGIRLALGAGRAAVTRRFAWSGTRLALAGMVAGFLGSYWTVPAIEDFLFAVEPFDARAIGAAFALLVASIATAAWLAARQAARVSPLEALKVE